MLIHPPYLNLKSIMGPSSVGEYSTPVQSEGTSIESKIFQHSNFTYRCPVLISGCAFSVKSKDKLIMEQIVMSSLICLLMRVLMDGIISLFMI